MRTELIRIGNSRGVRIPKPLIEQAGLSSRVLLRVENGRIVISPEHRPREKWDEAFRCAGSSSEDEIFFDALPNAFDEQEWRW
jgi:antitoxin MazE